MGVGDGSQDEGRATTQSESWSTFTSGTSLSDTHVSEDTSAKIVCVRPFLA